MPMWSVVEHSLVRGEVTRSIRVMGTTFPLPLFLCLNKFAAGAQDGKRQV